MPVRPAGESATAAELIEALGGGISSTTPVAEVTRRLLDYFTSRAIEPGTRLPPERQLATSMGVGRSAIREALAALEVLGVVNVRPGSGTYLRGTVSELLPQALSWGVLLGEPQTRELIGVRHGLEVQAARLAAEVINDWDLDSLTADLAEMEANQGNLAAFVAADMHFHQQIAAAADNHLLSELLQSIRSLLRVWVERALNDSDQAEVACHEHQASLAAVRRREPQAAADAMSAHMDTAGRRLIEQSGQDQDRSA